MNIYREDISSYFQKRFDKCLILSDHPQWAKKWKSGAINSEVFNFTEKKIFFRETKKNIYIFCQMLKSTDSIKIAFFSGFFSPLWIVVEINITWLRPQTYTLTVRSYQFWLGFEERLFWKVRSKSWLVVRLAYIFLLVYNMK